MRKLILKTIPLLLLCLLVFNSCKKSVAGPQGDKGENAPKGNLVQTDRIINVSASSWVFNGWYTADIYSPDITNDVITKGEIKVYMKINNQWWSLPYAVGDIFMEQTSETGYLHLKYSKIHGGPPPNPGAVTFRIVISSPA